MTLIRLLFLVPSVLLFNNAYIPPTTIPRDEVVHNGPLYERICPAVFPMLHRVSTKCPTFVYILMNIRLQLLGSIPCVAEIAAILAAYFPSPISSVVLSNLVRSGQLPDMMLHRYFVLGTTLVIIGGLGRIWCFRVMGRHFTFWLSICKDHTLVTMGPYDVVRHPSYAASCIILCGMSLIYASPGSFVLSSGWLSTYFGRVMFTLWVLQLILSVMVCWRRCIKEDSMLREHFRDEWERWSKRVRYRLIPGVF
jgi:protein-S-isoprenylcysteine O-methyltransferase Ste14